jgi:hypothetical protein
VVTGQLMDWVGPRGFWLFILLLFVAIAVYALWRMTRRASVPVDETGAYVGVMPTASPVAVNAAQDWYIEQAEEQAEEQAQLQRDTDARD